MSLPPFDRVVTEHGDVVYRVCRAVLGPADAEDAWSETFLSALRAYPRLRAGSNVRGWLVTIAHRKAIDVHRKARRTVLTDAPPEQASATGIPTEPDAELTAAIAALPPKQRLSVVYRYLGDLSYADVAALLETTEAAARRNAADGIAALRRNPTLQDLEVSS